MKVSVVDHQVIIRIGLAALFSLSKEVEFLTEATTIKEFISQLEKRNIPDIVLVDVASIKMSEMEVVNELKERFPKMKIVIFTNDVNEKQIVEVMKIGVNGYLLKDISPKELEVALKQIYKGIYYVDVRITSVMMLALQKSLHEEENYLHTLTAREHDVLAEIVKGKSNKEIARDLYITEKTVKTHVTNLLSKLAVKDRTCAALYAIKHGMKVG
ncbi:MAG: LuxR C-terminal-related transcriptional regulator [Bacillaceae bacterium]